MNNIRLLKTGAHSAAWNMALDEAMMQIAAESNEWIPSLRFYSWTPSAVSIGYFQSLNEEVDLDACKKHGVDIVRRLTGGGAVFHDSELTYSFITKEYPNGIHDSYHLICGAITDGLKTIGIDSQFIPINDLLVNGKKFSGNAQTRKKGVLLQHGTILLKVDVDKMFELLKVPNEKLKGKLISDVKQRVTALDKSFEEVESALEKGFAQRFNANVERSELSDEELKKCNELISKYSSMEWVGRI
ncbi:MAG: biotin/lipoate A/B protein ligase family protein [Candidatus Micrarchaeota archaeon]|nr:biotin/lipoate A/B protein ligase family protein [Candidatus Micrarchaeota archaeon]